MAKEKLTREMENAVDEVARRMLVEYERAQYSLTITTTGIFDPTYRVQVGRVQGMEVALSCLAEKFDLGEQATEALKFVTENRLNLTEE